MNIILRVSIITSLLALLVSCSTIQKTSKSNDLINSSLTEEQEFEFKYNFFEANRFFLAGNYDMAVSVFNQCLVIDPYSKVVHYKLASIYLSKKDLSTASLHADQITNSNDNIWYIYLAGTIYGQSNQKDKAITAFNKLIILEPKQMDFYLSLADVYLQNNDLNDAIKVYDNVDKVFGKSELISIQKNKIYMSLNKKNDAINELYELYEYFGKDPAYKRLIADFYIQTNEIDKAVITYSEILEDNDQDGYALIGLAECYRLNGDVNNSFIYLKKAFNAEDLPSDVKVQLLFNMLQSAQNNLELQKEIYQLVDILYVQYPDNIDIKTLYVNLLIDKEKFVEARDLLREVVKVRKDKYAVWEQLILLENQLGAWDTMYSEATEAVSLFPTQSFLHFFQGFSAFQIKKYEEALLAFEFGFRLTTIDDPLRQDFISFLGEVNYNLGHKMKAYSYFDQFLSKDPENVGILNNYAYYLSLDNDHLDKAAKMSKLTVDKDDSNSTYLDTYAWVLFMQKDYSNALIYIEKAIKYNTDNSPVIIEHYGDILFYNNNISEALIQWNIAWDMDDSNIILRKKIDAKMYLEE